MKDKTKEMTEEQIKSNVAIISALGDMLKNGAKTEDVKELAKILFQPKEKTYERSQW